MQSELLTIPNSVPVNPNYDSSNPLYSPVSYYGYIPNLGFNVFATVVWAVIGLVHVWWLATKRGTRGIQGLLVLGSAWEFSDYLLRSIGHSSPFRAPIFASQYIGNLFTPLFFIIALQLVLGKILWSRSENALLAFDRPKAIVGTLIGYSVIVLILNVIGSAMYTIGTNRSVQNITHNGLPNDAGVHVLLTAQGHQVAMLTLTLALLTWIIITYFRTRISCNILISPCVLVILYLTFGMLWVEAIYRLVETCQGWFGRAWMSEALYGVFEFATVWTCVAVWAVYPAWKVVEGVELRMSSKV